MRFGLSLPHYGFSLPTGETSFADVAGWARRAEALGFDSVWVSDHFFYSFARYGADPAPIASLEPLTTLAGVAAVTERVRLGTLVLCAAFRHPALLARAAASIDLLSGGRLDLGLGAGWMAEEFDAFGYRFGSVGERFAALEESLEVLQLLFGGEPVTYDGPTVTLRDAVLRRRPSDRRRCGWAARAAPGSSGWPRAWRTGGTRCGGSRPRRTRRRSRTSGRHARRRAATRPRSASRSVLYSLIGEDEAAARAAFERGRAAAPGDAMADRRLRVLAGRHAVGHARADPRARRRVRVARRARDHRVAVGAAVRDPRTRAGRAVRRARDRAVPRRLMEPRAAVLAVLTRGAGAAALDEDPGPRAPRGYLDPFEHPDVRRQVQTTLRALGGRGRRREGGEGRLLLGRACGRPDD